MCLVFAQGALASGRIFPDDSTKKCKEKKVKLEDVYDRISALDSMIQDLHSFVVDGKTSDNSAFMLRSEHQDALDSIKALNVKNRNLESKIEEKEKTIEEKEKTIAEKNVAYTQLKDDKEALRQQKDKELQLKTSQIETYKANEKEHAKLVVGLVNSLLKEATADEATINDLMELDNKINAAKNKKKLQDFLEIQSLIQSGNKITKSELKDNTIADFKNEMKKFENT